MAIYMPLLQDPGRNQPMLDVRTTGNPTALLPRIRQSLEAASNHYALRIQTLEQRADQLLLQERVVSMLSSSLGALSILLASIGLYGLISCVVAGRTAEIGIRMAVGAQPPDVLKLILRDVLLLVLTGIVGGAIMLGAASRLVSGMLFGLLPMDPKNLLLSGFILAATGLFAGYVPARRAARIDPIRTLRGEY
jgi:ABC-type antimicrobial peptide transport system permease subunit